MTSSSSDSDDDSSSSSSNSGNDPFNFQKHSFNRKPSTTPLKKRQKSFSSSDDDDEDDYENGEAKKQCTNATSLARQQQQEEPQKNQEAKEKNVPEPICLDINSSSEEEDNNARQYIPPSETLRKAHAAKLMLERVQKQHDRIKYLEQQQSVGVDDDDDDDSIEIIEPDCVATTTKDDGRIIRVKLQSQHELNSNRNEFKVKRSEPLERLVNQFRSMNNLHPNTTFQFQFHGQILNNTRAPSFYAIEDNDSIDVVTPNPPSTSSTSSSSTIVIKIQTNLQTTHKFLMKRIDPFTKLIEAYIQQHPSQDVIQLLYNNNTLDWESTPLRMSLYDPEVLLTMVVDDFNTNPATITKSHGICLKLRINGKDSDVQEYNVLPTDPFETLYKMFLEKNAPNDASQQISLTLDGCPLNLKTTPQDEDLEGDEIIDVIWKNRPGGDSDDKSSRKAVKRSITISTIRNGDKRSKKKFKLFNTDSFQILKEGYLQYYKSKGCKSVEFYIPSGKKIQKEEEIKSFKDLGITDLDELYAIENGTS